MDSPVGESDLIPVGAELPVKLATDFPIATAAALALSPLQTALVCFFGAWDAGELRGEVPLPKAIFNHSQVALGNGLASVAVHALSQHPARSSFVLPLGLLALGANLLLNCVVMVGALRLEYHLAPRSAVRAMPFGRPLDFALATISWVVLAAMLAALYDQIHPWALLAFLAPTVVGRQVMDRSHRLVTTSEAYEARGHALGQMSQRIADERSDERKLIAAELHDEVLQPLFKVTLMAQVLKADIQHGKLLDLDQDIPQLLSAAEQTSASLRDLIGDLRRSNLGRAGLEAALSSLLRETQKETSCRIEWFIGSVRNDPSTSLVVYQVAKEALANAIAHSQASLVKVELVQHQDDLTLTVLDNGIGFDPLRRRDGHFGMAIMRERALASGGHLFIDSFPGRGCVVRLTTPAEPDTPK